MLHKLHTFLVDQSSRKKPNHSKTLMVNRCLSTMHWCKHLASNTLNDILASESFFAALPPRRLRSSALGGMHVIPKRPGELRSSEGCTHELITKKISELLRPVEVLCMRKISVVCKILSNLHCGACTADDCRAVP